MCRYFALQLDTPARRKDFDILRWFLLHKKTSIFVEKKKWYVQIHNECRELLADHRCGVYETRAADFAAIIRRSTASTKRNWTYDLFFRGAEKLEEYIEARFPPRGKNIRSPKPGLPMFKRGRSSGARRSCFSITLRVFVTDYAEA